MGGLREVEEQDYVLLKHLKVEFRRDDDDDDDGAEEANGCFTLCFWIYIDNCASFPSEILVQVSQLLPSLNPPLFFFSFLCVRLHFLIEFPDFLSYRKCLRMQ